MAISGAVQPFIGHQNLHWFAKHDHILVVSIIYMILGNFGVLAAKNDYILSIFDHIVRVMH